MKSIFKHVQDWVEWMRVKNFSPATIQSYGYQIRHLVTFMDEEGLKKVEDVDKECLRRFWQWLRTSPKKFGMATLGVKCRATKSFFGYLLEQGVIVGNPSDVLQSPSKRLRLPKQAPSHAKVMDVLSAPDTSAPEGIRDRTVMEVMYSSGLRVEEVERLTIFDIDIQGGCLRVNQGKGRKDREVPLGIEASRWLRKYLEEARPHYRSRCTEPTDRLWLNRLGRPMSKQGMQWAVRKYREQADCQFPITPHAFRRAMATGMLSGGADIHSIGTILGHSSVQTTARYAQCVAKEVKQTHDQTHPRQGSTESSDKATPHIRPTKNSFSRRYVRKP